MILPSSRVTILKCEDKKSGDVVVYVIIDPFKLSDTGTTSQNRERFPMMFKWFTKENEWVMSERQRIVDDLVGVKGLSPDNFQKLLLALCEVRRLLMTNDITDFKTKLVGFDISMKEE